MNKRNVVLVLIDSLNRHSLGAYNSSTRVVTPNLDRFADRATRFDSHFVGSLPCMPARREIFTGRKEMMWRPWGPLEPFDARLPRLLAAEGYTTGIVTDHYHYWEEEANGYIQSFDSTTTVRGHENDNWHPAVPPSQLVPGWVEQIDRYRHGRGRAYYGNVRDFRGEEDYFPARVMTGASEWIRRNHGLGPFFLQVESFDVHEPFDVPEPYRSMYTEVTDRDQFNIWPPYQDSAAQREFLEAAEERELAYLRAQYDGKVSMVDAWLGRVLDTLDELALWDDTIVIVTTDHGHDLGERGAFGKQWPHFDSHSNIPLWIWHADYSPETRSVEGLSSTVDLHATILEMAGTHATTAPHSRSLIPLMRGKESPRNVVTYGTFGQGVAITDGRWTLLKSPESDGTLFSYSTAIFPTLTADNVQVPLDHGCFAPVDFGYFIPGVELPQWKIPVNVAARDTRDYLFDREGKQGGVRPIEEPAQADRLKRLLKRELDDEGCPPEQLTRLGLKG